MKQEIKEEVVEDFKKAKKGNKKRPTVKLEEASAKKTKNKASLNLDDAKIVNKVEEKSKKKRKEEAKKEQELNKKIKQKNKEKKYEQIMEDMVKKRKRTNLLLSISLLLVIIGIIFSTIFALININNENIFSNIYVSDINISNIPKEEAINKLLVEFNAISDKNITLKL